MIRGPSSGGSDRATRAPWPELAAKEGRGRKEG
jgi:hypothetical protein